jgi:acyl-CoA hydrolase
MAVDYNRARALAERMINQSGRTITLVNDAGVFDPTDPLGPPAARLEVSGIKGVFIRPSGYIKLGESFYTDPALWEEAEKIVLVLPSLEHNFAKFTRVLDSDGSGYKIFKVEELCPGDIPVLLYLGLRQ